MAKIQAVNSTIVDAVSNACSELQSLAEEIREVVDNASGTPRENTQRIQTLDETASTLENISEPEVDEKIAQLAVTYTESLPSGRSGLSRNDRRNNAVNMLDAAIEMLNKKSEEWSEGEGGTEEYPYQDLIDDLENMKGEAEAVEFPGMYG
jgi:hypothetical protein